MSTAIPLGFASHDVGSLTSWDNGTCVSTQTIKLCTRDLCLADMTRMQMRNTYAHIAICMRTVGIRTQQCSSAVKIIQQLRVIRLLLSYMGITPSQLMPEV